MKNEIFDDDVERIKDKIRPIYFSSEYNDDEKLTFIINTILRERYPLHSGLFPDSKDWNFSVYNNRIEWLVNMYNSKTQYIKQLEVWLNEHSSF